MKNNVRLRDTALMRITTIKVNLTDRCEDTIFLTVDTFMVHITMNIVNE